MAIESADELLTVAEVAERLRVHPITVRRHIKAGRLRAVRFGRSVRVRASDLESYLLSRAAPVIRPRRWPPTPEEMERRRKIVEEMRARRDRRPPLGMTTAELVRLARTARDWMYDNKK